MAQFGDHSKTEKKDFTKPALVAIGVAMALLFVVAACGGDLLVHIKTYLATYIFAFALMIIAFLLPRDFSQWQWKLVLLFAVVFRVIMIFGPATLSDDINRYA